MSNVLNNERTRPRRDRTIVGSACVICEEPPQLKLRGERVLQLYCGHVTHEACLYEYIRDYEAQECPACDTPFRLDANRNGSVTNLEKFTTLLRNNQKNDSPVASITNNLATSASEPWSSRPTGDAESTISLHGSRRESGYSLTRGKSHSTTPQLDYCQSVTRNGSVVTNGMLPEISEGSRYNKRNDSEYHGSDVTSSTVHNVARCECLHPLPPPPSVSLQSEYLTINKQQTQHTITCLVTVEVPKLKEAHSRINENASIYSSAEPVEPSENGPNIEQQRSDIDISKNGESGPSALALENGDAITKQLIKRVDNWHGLDFYRFGQLRLYDKVRVGKNQHTWQNLECYLFTEMLICVRERRSSTSSSRPTQVTDTTVSGVSADGKSMTGVGCTLKGSILRRHVKGVNISQENDEPVLTLVLCVEELPTFHMKFSSFAKMAQWRNELLNLMKSPTLKPKGNGDNDQEVNGKLETTTAHENGSIEECGSIASPAGVADGVELVNQGQNSQALSVRGVMERNGDSEFPGTSLDVVVVVPLLSSMQGLKLTVLCDTLRRITRILGDRDRMGLVGFGGSRESNSVVRLVGGEWDGWNTVLESLRPMSPKGVLGDVVEGVRGALDLLDQRSTRGDISVLLVISDSPTVDTDYLNTVTSWANEEHVAIHTFGLGLAHIPNTLMELGGQSKGSYTYINDWMMLPDCLAGCIRTVKATSHLDARLCLRVPDASPVQFDRILGEGETLICKKDGRWGEIDLGNLWFGEKRDILVQLHVNLADRVSAKHTASCESESSSWGLLVSELQELSGLTEQEDGDGFALGNEIPLLQAEVVYNGVSRKGHGKQRTRPTLLTIAITDGDANSHDPPVRTDAKSSDAPGQDTSEEAVKKDSENNNNATEESVITTQDKPPEVCVKRTLMQPAVLQRRIELLTADTLWKALKLVTKGQHEMASWLLSGMQTVLNEFYPDKLDSGRASLGCNSVHNSDVRVNGAAPSINGDDAANKSSGVLRSHAHAVAASLDGVLNRDIIFALRTEVECALEWILHPLVFERDARKAVFQAICVIRSQRAFTLRSKLEQIWARPVIGNSNGDADTSAYNELKASSPRD